MSDEELTFVELSERAYKYIRQFTIKSSEDALIELITNCIDAYNKTTQNPRNIFIEFQPPNSLKVRDYALGLTASEMEYCFLQVGNFTNDGNSRGFFSRGAKDISAIGDIYFRAIKDNKFSLCILNSDAYGGVTIRDVEATTEIREELQIRDNLNGLEVEIKLLDNFIVQNPSDQAESVSKLAVLRDIMQNSDNNIIYSHVDVDGTHLFDRRLLFDYPEGTLLLDLEYEVPFYSGINAKFVVYKSLHPIPQPKKENEMIFGFLIKSDATVYEVSTIDDRFRWNPYINVLYGYLKCDHIAVLLREFDTTGSTTANPVPIIDPSRLSGVNPEHPFIGSLLSIPKVRLDQILRELNQSLSQRTISLKEVDQLFDELAKYGLNIVEEEEITVNFVPSYDAELAKAIEDDRLNYVTSEKNYLITRDLQTQLTETDQYIKDQIIRIEPDQTEEYVYVIGDNNELVQIPNNTSDNLEDPVDILDLIENTEGVDLETRPYVYQLTSDGDLVKLYIFEKGRIENITNPEHEYVVIKNKKFQISFINDINLVKRYIIEYSDGIHIKLNLNNESIKKYLVSDTLTDPELTINNIGSSLSLTFLQELIIEILSEVILENDILNNRLILDSNTYNNTKKISDHKAKIIARLEVPVDSLFDKYIAANKLEKTVQLSTEIGSIGDAIVAKLGFTEADGELIFLRETLENLIGQLVE